MNEEITKIAARDLAGQTARPQPQLKLRHEIAGPSGPRGKQSQGGSSERAYGQILPFDQPAVVAQGDEAVLQRDRRRSEACCERSQTAGARSLRQGASMRLVPRVHAVDEQTRARHLPWRYARRRKAPQPVRAVKKFIRKGQAGKPNDSVKMVKRPEAQTRS